jgi:predicted TIM-barrel fold metal-dependent hydrolase
MPNIVFSEVHDRSAERRPATFEPEPSPEEIWCPLISVDDHVLEPPDLFDGRVPQQYAGRMPRVEFDDEAVPYWSIDDNWYPISTPNGAVGRPITEWTVAPQKYDEFRPGVFDPVARLADMDLCGVWASLNFPSIMWGFAGRRISSMRDQHAALIALRAYNSWMIESWCGAAPDRFIPCQLPWLSDARLAAREIEHNAVAGFKAVSFPENPSFLGLPSIHTDYWDPFFAACADTGTVVNLHVGSAGATHVPSPDTPVDARVALFPLSGLVAAVDWVYSRAPLRFPSLKIALSEAGVSWVPTAIERLNRAYRQVDASAIWSRADPNPVEVLLRNFWFTSIEDPSAFHMLDVIGEHKVMVEMDYPHPDSSWPYFQRMVSAQLAHLPRESVERICFGNAAELYRHPVPTQSWRSELRSARGEGA